MYDPEGNIIGVSYLYSNLPDTAFFGLNTQACFAKNAGLIPTFGDPGDQLQFLEESLEKARTAGKSMIIAGNVSPGHPLCNRQWSERYNILIDAF